MAAEKKPEEKRETLPVPADMRESGVPGGGKGRKDEVTKHGIWPYSVPRPPDVQVEPEIRPPGSITHAPYDESGRGDIFLYHGEVVGGAPPSEILEEQKRSSEGPKDKNDKSST